jgi:hypothetical protein
MPGRRSTTIRRAAVPASVPACERRALRPDASLLLLLLLTQLIVAAAHRVRNALQRRLF